MPIPASVRAAYAIDSSTARHVPSLINDTFIVDAAPLGRRLRLVLQRLHPVFGREVHGDIEAVTRHLVSRGLETPTLVRTVDGCLDHVGDDDDRPWRALTFVPGVTVHVSRNPEQLASAGRLLAQFHRALADLAHEFRSQRPLHDTPHHLEALRQALAAPEARGDADVQSLGAEILRHAEGVEQTFESEPRRVIHGDPKLSNLLFFDDEPTLARCMIDLDTVGRGPLAFELGDAMRSWCNPAGEDAPRPRLETTLLEAVLGGYLSAAPDDLRPAEVASMILGLETVSCELSSRFAADAIRDCYFGWDRARFASRRQHNLARARSQLALSRAVRARRDELLSLAARMHAAAAE